MTDNPAIDNPVTDIPAIDIPAIDIPAIDIPAIDNPVIDTCLVLAKRPVAGRVKTRLTPQCSPQQAADLAAAALADTLDAVERSGIARLVLVADDPCPELERPGWTLARQCAGDLAQRIADAFERFGRGPTVLIGMDTPQLTAAQLTAFAPDRFDAALGGATDGGYWALALRDPRDATAALAGIPMSRSCTGLLQRRRLDTLGLRVQPLAELTDVDTVADAEHVAALAPHGRFATALRAVRPLAAAS